MYMHIRLRYVVHVTWLVQSKLTYGRININCKNIYVTDIHSCTCIARTCSTTANMTYCTCIYTYLYTCMYIYIYICLHRILCARPYTQAQVLGVSCCHESIINCNAAPPRYKPAPAVDGVPLVSWAISI